MKIYLLIILAFVAAFFAVFYEGRQLEKQKCALENKDQKIEIQKNVIKTKINQSEIHIDVSDPAFDLWLQRINEERGSK